MFVSYADISYPLKGIGYARRIYALVSLSCGSGLEEDIIVCMTAVINLSNKKWYWWEAKLIADYDVTDMSTETRDVKGAEALIVVHGGFELHSHVSDVIPDVEPNVPNMEAICSTILLLSVVTAPKSDNVALDMPKTLVERPKEVLLAREEVVTRTIDEALS